MSLAKTIAHRVEAVKGAARVIFGRVTGNRRLQARGRHERAKGNIKQHGTKIKNAFQDPREQGGPSVSSARPLPAAAP
jgi:uncharacterized protein YjbJ (UPF0337 family)